jgi:RimJ/RimL family protein N-acetyltransferase
MIKAIDKLESERLELIPMNESFCSASYLNWLNDSEVNKYLESGSDYKMDSLRKYIRQAIKNNLFFWAICIKCNGKHIGNIKIDPIHPIHGLGEYGILIGEKSEWGKGYAYEASKLVIDHCFYTLGIRKINLGVVEGNISAVNLYKKLGFTIEGLYKNHIVYDLKYHNSLRMALFNPLYTY